MSKVIQSILALVIITAVIGINNAYAVPDCTAAGVKEDLKTNEMYVGSSTGGLVKVDTNDAKTCKVGDMKFGAIPVLCTDLALDSTQPDLYGNTKLYCVTFTDLYEIDRKTAAATFIGNLVDTTKPLSIFVTDMNGMEIDFGGLAYAISDSGKLYRVDLTDGTLLLLKDFMEQSSGDLAWESTTGNLFWTSNTCPGCPAGVDGLYEIDLSVVPPTSTFIGPIGFTDVFATDFVDMSPNIFYVNFAGLLIETDTAATPVGTTMTDPKVAAFGGTANQALVGGILQAIDQLELIINGFESISTWFTSGAI
ncbi:MAG TPA: hypothetical protein VD731_00705, partial [Nitrosopumilaceae archaeon]|nr:hypothetical protein [Nitrosopumilaceae archaeon]